jgi:TRAP-type C4-dicarboxylate transport system permease small subunit
MNNRTKLQSLSKRLKLFSSILAYIGILALLIMMILTALDVIGRYFFNRPILGVYELTEFMVLILIFSFIGYTQAHKSHVSVDLFMMFLPGKLRVIIDFITHLLCLMMMALITWMGIVKVKDLMDAGEASPNLGIPTYPFAIFLVIGCAAMCVEYFRDIIHLLHNRKEQKGS